MKSKVSSDEILIRDVVPDSDYQFFAKVRADSSAFLDDGRDFSEQQVRKFLLDNFNNYRMVEISGTLVGYVRLNPVLVEGVTCTAVGLDLAIEARGQRLAQPIYEKLLASLSEYSQDIVLWVLGFNSRAIHIYENLGFKRISEEAFVQVGTGNPTVRIFMVYQK